MSLTRKISFAALRNSRRLNVKLILSESIWDAPAAFYTVHSPDLCQVLVTLEFTPTLSVSNQWLPPPPLTGRATRGPATSESKTNNNKRDPVTLGFNSVLQVLLFLHCPSPASSQTFKWEVPESLERERRMATPQDSLVYPSCLGPYLT